MAPLWTYVYARHGAVNYPAGLGWLALRLEWDLSRGRGVPNETHVDVDVAVAVDAVVVVGQAVVGVVGWCGCCGCC